MQYRKQALAAMPPKERLLLTYDLAWKAANAGEMNKLLQLLTLLRMALHFSEHPLIALNALRVYRHCEQVLAERQDFAEVSRIMFNLKRALTIAKSMPSTPEAMEQRERVRKAKAAGVLFFGKHGRHYGPRPRNSRNIKKQNDVTVSGSEPKPVKVDVSR